MEIFESINNLDATEFHDKMIYGECYIRKGLIIRRDRKKHIKSAPKKKMRSEF